MTADASGLQSLIDQTPAMLWRGDQEGRCVFLNRAQREFWGVGEGGLDNFQWSTTLLAEDQDKVFGPFSEGMQERKSFTCEARYRRADGAVRVLRTIANPYFSTEGGFLGMVGVNEDVTDIRDLQAILAQRNDDLAGSLQVASAAKARFELASRISGLAMSEHDADLRYTWGHNLPGEFEGLTPEEYIGGEMGARVQTILSDVRTTGESADLEIDFLLDGRRHWWDIQACRITTRENEHKIIACALDVTTRKLNEGKLEVLSRELGHRVKNFYSLTQAFLQQSARAANVDREFVTNISQRLTALSRAQDALFESPDDRVSVRSLVDSHLAHLNRVNATGDAATVLGRSAIYLALALHELGTNALKYGALAHDGGTVDLTWRQNSKGDVHIVWQEECPDFVIPESGDGFGTSLITRIFAASTNGDSTREFTPRGLRWSGVIPTAPDISVSYEKADVG